MQSDKRYTVILAEVEKTKDRDRPREKYEEPKKREMGRNSYLKGYADRRRHGTGRT